MTSRSRSSQSQTSPNASLRWRSASPPDAATGSPRGSPKISRSTVCVSRGLLARPRVSRSGSNVRRELSSTESRQVAIDDAVRCSVRARLRAVPESGAGELVIGAHVFFFLPLALDPFLTGVSNTLVNAFMARAADREVLIAGYGVAKNLLFLLFGVLMMVRQTVTCFAEDRPSLAVLKKFFTVVVLANVALLAFVAFTPVAGFVFGRILGVGEPALSQAVRVFRVFVAFPIAVGFRHFWQGYALKRRKPSIIAASIIGRVVFLAVLVYGIMLGVRPAAENSAALFMSSVAFEGVLVYGLVIVLGIALPRRRDDRSVPETETTITPHEIGGFFFPLAATALIRTMALPILNAGLSRAVNPELALASFTVGWELGYIFFAPMMLFHHVPIEFLSRGGDHRMRVALTALLFAGSATVVLVALGFTPLGPLVLERFVGVSGDLLAGAVVSLRILALLPAFYGVREYFWGVLMFERRTKPISFCKAVALVVLVAWVVFAATFYPTRPWVIVFGLIASELTEVILLAILARKDRLATAAGASEMPPVSPRSDRP
ncbi:MAG: hypothetical protein EA426_04775 [Spirochaetaceae bacterium]|nr:MAG: hypothetical protein EA426_04775 [Spirochaetaceae bacterium]